MCKFFKNIDSEDSYCILGLFLLLILILPVFLIERKQSYDFCF